MLDLTEAIIVCPKHVFYSKVHAYIFFLLFDYLMCVIYMIVMFCWLDFCNYFRERFSLLVDIALVPIHLHIGSMKFDSGDIFRRVNLQIYYQRFDPSTS